MKKLILKTALITLGAAILLSVAVFGILSLAAPGVMMNFTSSIGLSSVSGDYAYQEYERSGDLDCLARSFLIAAEHKEDVKADERFQVLSEAEKFDEYCESKSVTGEGVPAYDFRGYLFGQAARVKYRRAMTDEARAEVIDFALAETDKSFPEGNAFSMLAVEAAEREDGAMCALLLNKLKEGGFDGNSEYEAVLHILENSSEGHANA